MSIRLFSKKRETEQFERLAGESERQVYAVCFHMMGSREDAQDCAQEALLRAYRAFDSFRGQASPKTWLYRIAYNACLDFLRRRKDTASLDELRESGFDPADSRMPQPGDRSAGGDRAAGLSAAALRRDRGDTGGQRGHGEKPTQPRPGKNEKYFDADGTKRFFLRPSR